MKKILILTIVTFRLLYSQNENLNESFKYFPLQIGNFWEYKVERISGFPNPRVDSTWYASSEIIKDTLIENKLYYLFYNKNMRKFIIHSFIRLDSITGSIFERSNGNEIIRDNVFLKVGDKIDAYLVKKIYYKDLFGLAKETKVYIQYILTNTGSYGWELSKDFGITTIQDSDHSVYIILDKYTLTYSKINNVEFGIRTEVSNILNLKNKYNLEQNFPNPFNPTTLINYYLPRNSFIDISVYNLLGEKVTTLFNGVQEKGDHQAKFNESSLPGGIYFYVLDYGESKISKKMVLIK